MSLRPVMVLVALAATAVGLPPALAAPAKRPIQISYTASALPDPTSTNPLTNEICVPTVPGSLHRYAFTVPAQGVLYLALNNVLDWSVAVRKASGATLVASDGTRRNAREVVAVAFSKATTISIDACNVAGEPSVNVTGTFRFL